MDNETNSSATILDKLRQAANIKMSLKKGRFVTAITLIQGEIRKWSQSDIQELVDAFSDLAGGLEKDKKILQEYFTTLPPLSFLLKVQDPRLLKEIQSKMPNATPPERPKEVDEGVESVPEIRSLLKTATGSLRARLLMKLFKKDALQQEEASALLTDSEWTSRTLALNWIATKGKKSDWPHIASALRDPDEFVRYEAVQLIFKLNAKEFANEVAALLDDPRENISGMAREALKKWGVKGKLGPSFDKFGKEGLVDLNAFLETLGKTSLSSSVEKLKAEIKPTIRILLSKAAEASLKPGNSKLGGTPDLPPDATWPESDGRAMAFVGQINLAETSKFDKEKHLPGKGLLSFFVDSDNIGEPPGSGKEKVLYFSDTNNLKPVKAPKALAKHDVFGVRKINFRSEFSLPSQNSTFARKLGNLQSKYNAHLEEMGMSILDPSDRMLGHANFIQDDVLSDQPDAVLLLQVDSDKKSKMMWGDRGRLMFLIKADDLKKNNFNAVYMEMQGS